MNRIIKKNYLISLVSILLLISCNNNSSDIVYEQTSTCGFELDEDRIAIVNEISDIFQSEMEQAIKSINTNDLKAFSVYVTDNFNNSVNKNYNQPSLKSGLVDSINIDLQPYYDDLTEITLNVIPNDDDDKETYLKQINIAISDYTETIMSDPILEDIEKQVIIENIIFKGNLLTTFLIYGEEFSENTDLKSASSCNWFCRNKKIIDCTIRSVFAVGVCGGSVALLISGNYVVGAFGSVFCYIYVEDAINCWKNI